MSSPFKKYEFLVTRESAKRKTRNVRWINWDEGEDTRDYTVVVVFELRDRLVPEYNVVKNGTSYHLPGQFYLLPDVSHPPSKRTLTE